MKEWRDRLGGALNVLRGLAKDAKKREDADHEAWAHFRAACRPPGRRWEKSTSTSIGRSRTIASTKAVYPPRTIDHPAAHAREGTTIFPALLTVTSRDPFRGST